MLAKKKFPSSKSASALLSILAGQRKKLAADITPVLQNVKTLVFLLEQALKKQKLKARVIVGGSLAKDTYLPGDHDVDVFVAFHPSCRASDLSHLLGSVLSQLPQVSVNRLHGSRDYFQLTARAAPGPTFEIIPVLDIKKPSEAENITDCSPLHVAWVKKQLAKKPSLAAEIKLTKAFCKAAGVYGAESYIRGFSGHVVDILTIYYGSFLNLLKAARKWTDKTVIDFYHSHKNVRLEMNTSKLQSPIVVVDPIQKDRNAAAALGAAPWERFRVTARQFLEHPSSDFFVRKELSRTELRQRAGNNQLILIDIEPLDGKEDVVGAKLLKAFEHLKKQLREYEFELLDTGWMWDKKRKALFFFIVPPDPLSPLRLIVGPALVHEKHVEHFHFVHPKTFEKNGHIFAEEPRRFRSAASLLITLVKDEYVRTKVAGARVNEV